MVEEDVKTERPLGGCGSVACLSDRAASLDLRPRLVQPLRRVRLGIAQCWIAHPRSERGRDGLVGLDPRWRGLLSA